jgi:hypothetical protein
MPSPKELCGTAPERIQPNYNPGFATADFDIKTPSFAADASSEQVKKIGSPASNDQDRPGSFIWRADIGSVCFAAGAPF